MISRRSPIRKKNNSNRGKAGRRWVAGFESLENRHLLSSVGLNNDGIVEVQGTEEGDEIAAYVDGEQFVVEINGATVGYNNADVEGLYVEALGGDDNVRVDNSVLQPTLIFGGIGNDTIQGGAGVDVILGGSDDDTIYGNIANDVLLGDGPNSLADVPLPEPGEPPVEIALDTPIIVDLAPVDPTDPNSGPLGLYKYLSRVSGINSGSDTIVGGTGSDLVFAGQHDDSVEGDGANVIPVPDDEGEDDEGETVKSNAMTDVAPPDILPPGNDYIEAGTGNDKVDAGYGANIVFGGAGNDTLVSGGGADIALGGSGDDTIETNAGNDTVLGDGPNTINQVILTSNNYYLANSALGRGRDYIESGAGEDTVYAGRDRDAVFAGAGDDFAHGGPGSDLLVGGSGADTLIGGRGNDVIITGGPNFGPFVDPIDDLVNALSQDGELVHDQSNDYVEAGHGNDLVFAFGGHDLVFGGTGADNLFAGPGNDILVGGSGNDNIRAGGGNDVALGDGPDSLADAILPLEPPASVADPNWLGVLLANSQLGRGDDVIDGGAGNDLMFGGAATDMIFGRTGNDLLHGGRGDDELHDDLNSGGDGIDVFIGALGADKIFAHDGPGGPVDVVFYDLDDELNVDGEDLLILV